MGVDVSAYVEKKNKETGKWELVTENPVSSRLKYILDDYNEIQKIGWDDLSDGLKEKFKKDDSGNVYANFHVTTLDELENSAARLTSETYTRINTIVKALGATRIYRDDGEELWGDGEGSKESLTFQVNKELVDDLQLAYGTIRSIGQREALDVVLSEHVGYDTEYRIILTVV